MSSFLSRRLPAPRGAALTLVVVVMTSALSPAAMRAQLYLGDTVRLSVADLELRRGAFVRADTAAIYLRTAGELAPSRIPYTSYTRAEVLLGRQPAGGQALARGALVGSAIGAAGGLSSVLLHPGRGGISSSAISTVVGALLGATLGIGVGAAASGVREEVWRSVDVQRLAAAQVVAAAAVAPRDTAIGAGGTPVTLAIARPVRMPGVVATGDTVRLSIGRELLVYGTLVAADSAGLVVTPFESVTTARYERSQFTVAEVQRGRRRRGFSALGKGAVIGVGIGAGFVTLGFTIRDPRNEGMDVLAGIFLGAASAAIGTVVGGVVGLTYADVWVPFDPATLRMMPAVM